MNGQPADPEKPPPEAAASPGSNGADTLAKKRKKESLKPIITTESKLPPSKQSQQQQEDSSGCVFDAITFSSCVSCFVFGPFVSHCYQSYQGAKNFVVLSLGVAWVTFLLALGTCCTRLCAMGFMPN